MQIKTTKHANFMNHIGKKIKSNNNRCWPRWPRFGEICIYLYFGESENFSNTLIEKVVNIFNILKSHTLIQIIIGGKEKEGGMR